VTQRCFLVEEKRFGSRIDIRETGGKSMRSNEFEGECKL
jgi:hypothetical protein